MHSDSDDYFSGDDDDFDRQQEIARSAFADMCHDWERNQKYDRALQLTIERLHCEGKEAHVLDIGTGSGLLSMMAVRAGADSVTACEAFRPMADCAERVIASNGMGHRIRLVKKKSTELEVGAGKDMERKANVLVTELFDTELIGEGAIATYRHALQFLLEEGCRVIPDKATVYAQVVECPLAMSWQTPKLLCSSDGDVLLRVPEEMVNCRGSSAVFDVQLSQLPLESFNALSEPIPVFEFDWSSREALKFKRHSRNLLKVQSSGIPQAVFMWWDLKMDLEGTVLLSCAPFWAHPDFEELKTQKQNDSIPEPNLIPWRDHWMQAIYFLPHSKTPLAKGEEIALDAFHDEFSWWFGLNDLSLDPGHCSCGMHIAYSRSRIGQLNDGPRNKRMLNYLEEVLDKNSVVLVLGDGSLLGLSIRAMGAKKVILVETNQTSRHCMERLVEHNGLENVEILSCLDDLTPDATADMTHIFGEPFFTSAILPWENAIQFIWELNRVKALLNHEVSVIPHSFSIYGVAVEFLDLQKISAPLGTCEGFDLSLMDRMIEEHSKVADSPVEAQPLWEYPCLPLGPKCKMITINVAEGSQNQLEQGKITLTRHHEIKECNGIALWAEWHMGKNVSPKNTISTGPLSVIDEASELPVRPLQWNSNWRQGVHLLRKPLEESKMFLSWTVKYNAQLKSCYFKFD
ncbi:protein arginine N-methyltransferase 7 isoform X1 [Aedes aegypti]|uniref:Protein arginine N-methyltransferase n=1 Tax=Aedes aegypti TaxID=7159 RepID=A0A6I8TMY2_AEDAE|nr:protein arginine N-methyltransferase 7 isoform X1 [Aedes aegypti]XP_021699135.1 protein arginine N-methyltransferase 7 isoform X1 [Aedes aegypti]